MGNLFVTYIKVINLLAKSFDFYQSNINISTSFVSFSINMHAIIVICKTFLILQLISGLSK